VPDTTAHDGADQDIGIEDDHVNELSPLLDGAAA
jgi:hypothetical protein